MNFKVVDLDTDEVVDILSEKQLRVRKVTGNQIADLRAGRIKAVFDYDYDVEYRL